MKKIFGLTLLLPLVAFAENLPSEADIQKAFIDRTKKAFEEAKASAGVTENSDGFAEYQAMADKALKSIRIKKMGECALISPNRFECDTLVSFPDPETGEIISERGKGIIAREQNTWFIPDE
ncbi:hypothetical protein [Neisseria sp. Ec49-e6-T10]|uniref:hypothetical protein n=1 Tax=Neisseria sp. Ec49-e6-T10 TaxID=3140744 RepID=UPI003EBC6C1A